MMRKSEARAPKMEAKCEPKSKKKCENQGMEKCVQKLVQKLFFFDASNLQKR